MSETPYIINKDASGAIQSIRTASSNDEISVDAASPEYCDFVRWASQEESPVAPTYEALRPDLQYFSCIDEVTDYCKRNSVVLFVEGLGGGRREQFSIYHDPPLHPGQFFLKHSPGTVRNGISDDELGFYPLTRAVATPDMYERDWRFGFSPEPLPVAVSNALFAVMNAELHKADSDLRCLSNWPVEKTFVYVDVSGFSQHPVGQQLSIINSLIGLCDDPQHWKGSVPSEVKKFHEASLCIGDGYIFVFREPPFAVFFAAYLANLIETSIAEGKLAEFHFRISVHTGEVFRFWDRFAGGQGRWNYVGTGITEGRRVLEAIGASKDDVVYVSAQTRQKILLLPEGPYCVAECLQNRGRRRDKHRIFRRVYEMSHTGWAGRYR